jgi:hypothetical protein
MTIDFTAAGIGDVPVEADQRCDQLQTARATGDQLRVPDPQDVDPLGASDERLDLVCDVPGQSDPAQVTVLPPAFQE